MNLIFKIVLLLTCTLQLTFGQHKKAKASYDKAEELYQKKQYAAALTLYLKAIEKQGDWAEPYYKAGRVYALNRNFSKAKVFYETAIELSPKNKEFMPAYSFLGSYYIDRDAYDKALGFYEFALEHAQPGSRYARQLERQVAQCKFVMLSFEKAYKIEPQELSPVVNRLDKQYFPVLSADENVMVFTARNNQSDENIYVSKKVDGNWSQPQSISDTINSPFNEGTCTISADGNMLVFTSCEGREGLGRCDLFYSQRVGGMWSTPENLGRNVNSSSWDSQPSLSSDGRWLFFSSSRPGGYGEKDLYVSKFENGEWTRAQNLGKNINTVGDEVSPFLHANGETLFFASNYHVGLGGYDIFLSQLEKEGFSKPLNLGYPINSKIDQLALFITPRGNTAYYSLDNGTHSKLYKFEIPQELKDKVVPTIYVKGKVVDKNQQGLEAKIDLYKVDNNEKISSFKTDLSDGSFTVVVPTAGEYALYIRNKDHFFKRINFDVHSLNQEAIEISLEKIEKEKAKTLDHIYFETGSYDLLDKSRSELDQLLQLASDNPQLNIRISGHTDDVGNEKDNQWLSEKRAEAVVMYLTENGLNSKRLEAKGFGENQPLIPNDSEESRAKNRRIELTFF